MADRVCSCGSGEYPNWRYDGIGLPLERACDKCWPQKKLRWRPEILKPYSQADVDEPIDPDD